MMEHANLTKGPLVGQMIRLSLPLLMSGLLQSLYGIVDMMVVGQVMGSVGLSAVSMGSQVMQVVTAFAIGLSVGGSVLVSQNIARGGNEQLRRILGTLTSLFLIVSLSITVLLAVLRREILLIFRTPGGAMEQAARYLLVCSMGILFIFAYNIISAVLRGMGNTRFSFYMALVSVVLNLLLDYLFVVPLQMGAFGAALATVLAQGVAAVAALIYLVQKNSPFLPRRRAEFRLDGEYLRLLLRVGIPAGAQPMVVFLSMLVVMGMVNSYGMTVSAAYGACMKIDSLSTLPRQAVAQAATVIVGQCFGVGDHKRTAKAVRSAAVISFLVCLLVAVLVWLFAPQLVSLFDSDAAVIAEGSRYLRIMVWGYPILGLMGAFNCLTTGIGFTSFALANSFLDSILARILFCKLLELAMGLEGIYLGLVFAPICAATLGGCYFFFGKWRERKALTAKGTAEKDF